MLRKQMSQGIVKLSIVLYSFRSISWNRVISQKKTIYDPGKSAEEPWSHSMPSLQIVSTKDKTESSTKQSTQSLASL
ncbi:12304_t:CDS:1, partial [Funneliformis geosporum]